MKKSELQSIIREEIKSALGEKNILNEAAKYKWDVTEHEDMSYYIGPHGRQPGSGPGVDRVVKWKKGQTVTVTAPTAFDAIQLAMAEVWGVDSKSKRSEWPSEQDVKWFSGSVKKK